MDFLSIIGFIVIIYFLIYMIIPWFLDCDLNLALHEKFGKPISSLQGKVIWIVGASSGIGEHLAYVLAEAGCKLILTARRETELERVKANCIQKNANLQSSDIEVLVMSIVNINDHEPAFNRIIAKFGKLDILVCNAGCSQRAEWEKIDIDVDKEMFDLNVFSQVALSRLVAKYFFNRGAGHFVITSSVAGIGPVPYSATYCGTKYALHGYFNSFAIEKLGQNIQVTIACPGPIETNFLSQAYTEQLGKKYGEEINKNSQNKLTAERCAILMGIAIANELTEVWISKPRILQLIYLRIYYPNIGFWIFRLLGPRILQRLRDDKATIKQEQ